METQLTEEEKEILQAHYGYDSFKIIEGNVNAYLLDRYEKGKEKERNIIVNRLKEIMGQSLLIGTEKRIMNKIIYNISNNKL